jgi:hypothetical protein
MDNSEVFRETGAGRRRRIGGLLGALAGGLAGVVAVMVTGTAVAQQTDGARVRALEATHLPPLLTAPGERVELRYDAICVGIETEVDAPCDVDGAVFVRAGSAGPYREIALRDDAGSPEGRLAAAVPPEIVHALRGFSYYAVLRDRAGGWSITIPTGGASAPQRSYPLGRAVEVALGAHAFGRGRSTGARVAEAGWGSGPSEAGLEQGRNLPPLGGSSFDVGADGSVSVLDEANKRVLRWQRGQSAPRSVPIEINGTLADMSVAEDGGIYVLESTERDGQAPLLREFASDGALQGAVEVPERASQVRLGDEGPVVLQSLSGQWRSAGDDGRLVAPSTQKSTGRAGRPLRGGGEVVVLRHDNEIRIALVGSLDVRKAWRIRSDTSLAEVQLAEPLGKGIVVVARVYSDTEDEFVVLRLDERGVADRFAVKSSDWAETAPLSRFRLVGPSLYQLGSTPAGLFVDRFDLEVR